ncbi:MAG: hypothetical protein AB1401_02320 [Thermodesulfobacteriota bacterium]
MEKKFNDCKLGGTHHCPKITNPIMKTSIPPRKDTEPVTHEITETLIDVRNQICSKCDSFTDNLDVIP